MDINTPPGSPKPRLNGKNQFHSTNENLNRSYSGRSNASTLSNREQIVENDGSYPNDLSVYSNASTLSNRGHYVYNDGSNSNALRVHSINPSKNTMSNVDIDKLLTDEFSELKHLAYFDEPCSVLEQDDIYLHEKLQNLNINDYLISVNNAIMCTSPSGNDVYSMIVGANCCADMKEFTNDGMISEGLLMFNEEVNTSTLKGGYQSGGTKLTMLPSTTVNLDPIDKLDWMLSVIDTIRRSDHKQKAFIQAFGFEYNMTRNGSTALDTVESIKKVTKILFKQPQAKIQLFRKKKRNLTNALPGIIQVRTAIRDFIPLSEYIPSITTESIRDISVHSQTIERYISINRNPAGEANRGNGTKLAEPADYTKYYGTNESIQVLCAASILNVLLQIHRIVKTAPDDASINSKIAKLLTTFAANHKFDASILKPKLDTKILGHKKYKNEMDRILNSFGEDANALRTDLFYLCVSQPNASEAPRFALAMNPSFSVVNVFVLEIMKILGANDLVSPIVISKPKILKDESYDEMMTTNKINPLGVDLVPTSTFKINDDKTRIMYNNDTIEKFPVMDQILPCVKTNGHEKYALMSELVYRSSNLVSDFFVRPSGPYSKGDLFYVGGFDEDPEWQLRGEMKIKHRIHVWLEFIEKNKFNVIIAVRGSHTTRDWYEIDLNITYGTAVWYEERVIKINSLISEIQKRVINVIGEMKNEHEQLILNEGTRTININFYSTGHSLGGFLGLMFAYNSLMGTVSEEREHYGLIFKFNQYIYPVVFNPFVGLHEKTMNAIKVLPSGDVYRVAGVEKSKSIIVGLATFYVGDLASVNIVQKPSNLNIHQIYHSFYRISNLNNGYMYGMQEFLINTAKVAKHAHFMSNFIGILSTYMEYLEPYGRLTQIKNYSRMIYGFGTQITDKPWKTIIMPPNINKSDGYLDSLLRTSVYNLSERIIAGRIAKIVSRASTVVAGGFNAFDGLLYYIWNITKGMTKIARIMFTKKIMSILILSIAAFKVIPLISNDVPLVQGSNGLMEFRMESMYPGFPVESYPVIMQNGRQFVIRDMEFFNQMQPGPTMAPNFLPTVQPPRLEMPPQSSVRNQRRAINQQTRRFQKSQLQPDYRPLPKPIKRYRKTRKQRN